MTDVEVERRMKVNYTSFNVNVDVFSDCLVFDISTPCVSCVQIECGNWLCDTCWTSAPSSGGTHFIVILAFV